MIIGDEFKSIIEDDIRKCANEIAVGSKMSRAQLFYVLVPKYNKIISGFGDDLLSLKYDESGAKLLNNLKALHQKLELFKAMGYPAIDVTTPGGLSPLVSVSNVNTNTNDNSNSVTINMSFEHARELVENMSALPESEIQETLEKINELEEIVKSKQRKGQKWEQAKGIIKWIADKGVDVGIALLPLLLQIG